MDLPPQPPPDAPAPPPGPEALRSRKMMSTICRIGGLSVVLFFSLPIISAYWRKKDRPRDEALWNLREIHLALLNFDNDHGRYPDSFTIPDVRAATHTELALGTATSNDYFRQLIANGTRSEKMFWAYTRAHPRKPNDILGTDALAKGECSFSYIPGLSTSSDPVTPVVMASMKRGTHEFDPKPFKGEAVILRVDGSAVAEPIRRDNHRVHPVGSSLNLFDRLQPYWHATPPDVKWPE